MLVKIKITTETLSEIVI